LNVNEGEGNVAMKVLLTGGAGFLGAWVARRFLNRGLEIRSLDLSNDLSIAQSILGSSVDQVDWVRGDISNGNDVRGAMRGCSGVIHIAGVLTPVCKTDPVRGAMVNLIGTLNVFEAAKHEGITQVLYTSTAAVFGPEDKSVPVPVSHYGAFKLASEGCARAYWADEGIASAALRPLVIFGPGRTLGPSSGVTLACRAAAEGRPFEISFTGRSGFIFVDEVAAAFEALLVAKLEGARVYNLWGDVADTGEVVEEIVRCVPGAQISATGPVLPVPADIDSTQIYQDFPQLKRIPLASGLRRTIEHYQVVAAAEM
jgi:nucleoside-diphosphate-sugar epimerase